MKTVLRSSIALSALTLALMSGSPASAGYEMVVIETNSAQFARGAIIDGAQPVSLEAGQSLTLIDSDGEVVTLTGPFAQAPVDLTNSGGGGDSDMVVALGALLTEHENSTATLGVIRSGGNEAEIGPLPDPWAISVDRSGTRCYQPSMVAFWRQDAGEAAELRIAAPRTGRSAMIDWPAGDDMLEVSGQSFSDGQSYVLSLEGREVTVTMHAIPADLVSVTEMAGWMAQTGCEAQALAMLDALR